MALDNSAFLEVVDQLSIPISAGERKISTSFGLEGTTFKKESGPALAQIPYRQTIRTRNWLNCGVHALTRACLGAATARNPSPVLVRASELSDMNGNFLQCLGRSPGGYPVEPHAASAANFPVSVPQANIAKQFGEPRIGSRILPEPPTATGVPHGFWHVLQRSRAKRMATHFKPSMMLARLCVIFEPRGDRKRRLHSRRRSGGVGNLIEGAIRQDPVLAIHLPGGFQHVSNQHWTVSADYIHEQGKPRVSRLHVAGRPNLVTPLLASNRSESGRLSFSDLNFSTSDNRSIYNNALMCSARERLQPFNPDRALPLSPGPRPGAACV